MGPLCLRATSTSDSDGRSVGSSHAGPRALSDDVMPVTISFPPASSTDYRAERACIFPPCLALESVADLVSCCQPRPTMRLTDEEKEVRREIEDWQHADASVASQSTGRMAQSMAWEAMEASACCQSSISRRTAFSSSVSRMGAGADTEEGSTGSLTQDVPERCRRTLDPAPRGRRRQEIDCYDPLPVSHR